MSGKFYIPFFILFLPLWLEAQTLPRDGDTLNYRLIGFSIPPKTGAKNYTLEIAAGYVYSQDSFRKKIIRTLFSKSNRIISEIPAFGRSYTWRMVSNTPGAAKTMTPFFHFTTGAIPEVDDKQTRLRVQHPATKHREAVFFLDCSKVLYDMTGRPIWYLPAIEGKIVTPKDLKLSSKGTITFITAESAEAYEINYDGEVLWKAPGDRKVSGTNAEHYHHELTVLDNGNYMILGTELLNARRLPRPDNSFRIVPDTGTQKIPFGTIIEYDRQGNVVWSWKSSAYYETSDLVYYRPQTTIFDMHENSFYFDESNKVIYLSCRDLNRVIKIKYPEGTVSNNYGEIYSPHAPVRGNALFCGQHSVSVSGRGLLLFNNNSCHMGAAPKLQVFREPGTGGNTLEPLWEFDCPLEDDAPKKYLSGGSAATLADGSIFACLGAIYSKTFIVTPDKKITWSAVPEKWNETEKKWVPFGLYKASIIENRQSLENLIFGTK